MEVMELMELDRVLAVAVAVAQRHQAQIVQQQMVATVEAGLALL